MIRIASDQFLYHVAKIVSYPTWVSACAIGVLLAAGGVTGAGWLVAALVLLGIAMPVGVKLSRMELTKSMVTVFQTGILFQQKQEELMMQQSASRRNTRSAVRSNLLHTDVAAMIDERHQDQDSEDLAHDIIVVVRERVLSELSSYARENIR